MSGRLGLRRRDGAAQEPDNLARIADAGGGDRARASRSATSSFVSAIRPGICAGARSAASRVTTAPARSWAIAAPAATSPSSSRRNARSRCRAWPCRRSCARRPTACSCSTSPTATSPSTTRSTRSWVFPIAHRSRDAGSTFQSTARSRQARRIRAGRSRDAGARTRRGAARDDRQPTRADLRSASS